MNAMKPVHFLTTISATFLATVLIAGFVPPDDGHSDANSPIPVSPRKRAASTQDPKADSASIPAILAGMERQVFHYQPPEMQSYDIQGLLESFRIRKQYASAVVSWGTPYEVEWARQAPQELFECLVGQNLIPQGRKRELAYSLFTVWAEKDMSGALAAIPRITHEESRAQALVSTLEVLCQKEPARARELLLQEMDTLGALKSVNLGFVHGKERTDLILALPPGKVRTLLLAENLYHLARDMDSGGAQLATELWNKSSLEDRRKMVAAGLSLYVSDTIQLEGLEDLAKQHAETTNDPEAARSFLNEFGKSWTARDPDSALSWTLSRFKGRERTYQYLNLIEEAAAKNFDEAMNAWQSLPEGSLRYKAAEILAKAAPDDRVDVKAMLEQSGSADGW